MILPGTRWNASLGKVSAALQGVSAALQGASAALKELPPRFAFYAFHGGFHGGSAFVDQKYALFSDTCAALTPRRMIPAMKTLILRAVFWVWFTTRGYYIWSKFWRAVLERKHHDQALTAYAHIGQLEEALGRMDWVADAGGGRFDVISSPQKVEAIWRKTRADANDKNELIGDCDEFAAYAANRIADLNARGQYYGIPHFMTVHWFDDQGGLHGHNICAVELPDPDAGWGHMGNWFGGRLQKGFASPEAIAQWWATGNPRDGKGKLIAWAMATPELVLERLWLG